ncbi:MAG TPA: hypothetical protein VK184_06380 [Nostocaceae cyanobacterium]|nr:hypothetical protein [Nostocaceae cyanobacterium]
MISQELNLHLSPDINEHQNMANLAIYRILSFCQPAIKKLYSILTKANNILMRCYCLTPANGELIHTRTRHTDTSFIFDKFMAHRGSGRRNQAKMPQTLG